MLICRLVTLLASDRSKTATTCPVITKKLRNELIGEHKFEFFERSRIYTVVKSLLQHSLTVEWNAVTGKILYKILMLQFLNVVCEPYTDIRAKINVELLSQMIAKIARRIEKLHTDSPKWPNDNDISSFYHDTIKNSKKLITEIRKKINNQIIEFQENEETRAELEPLIGLNFKSSVQHKIPNDTNQRLTQRRKNLDLHEVNSYSSYFVAAGKWPEIQTIASVEAKCKFNNLNDFERRLFWIDFENRVLYSSNLNNKTANILRSWALAYMKYAEIMYDGNPLSTSRMVLVCLKIIAKLDEHACEKYRLLSEHHSEINPKIIDALLLPQHIDMEIANELQQHFEQRNKNASYPSLNGENEVSDRSFSVRFAQNDDEMIEIRQEILDSDKRNVGEKKLEYIEMRNSLREKMNLLPTCSSPNLCNECENCTERKKVKKIKIKVYEHLLPDEECKQWAIIFELKIPREIACLRDVLHNFVKMFDTKHTHSEKKLEIEDWVKRPEFRELKPSSIAHIVRLGYTSKFIPTYVHVLEPMDTMENLIVTNISECIYHGDQSRMPPAIASEMEEIKKSWLCAPLKVIDEYQALQWALNGTTHTQNEVLTRHKSECPKNLSSAEYKEFGSLRAGGHRLQLFNLYAAIETEALSFEKESVLSLIMQTLWEYDPSIETYDNCSKTQIVREPHNDFSSEDFFLIMLKQLTKYTTEQQTNWMHPFKMLMVVLIALRMFEINNKFHNRCEEIVLLLNNIRSITDDWINKIENVIRDTNSVDKESEDQLRVKLIYVGVIGGLTFFVHPGHQQFDLILEKSDAPQKWLHFIITLKSNTEMLSRNETQLPSNLRMFLHVIERIGIDLEVAMKRLILEDTAQLQKLIQKYWSTYVVRPVDHSKFRELLTVIIDDDCTKRTQKLTIDIITGLLFVNGLPLSRLPSCILDSHVYKRFFGGISFEVQQDDENTFSTIKKYNDCTYEFRKETRDIIIIERDDKGIERRLIYYAKLKGNLKFVFPFWVLQSSPKKNFRF